MTLPASPFRRFQWSPVLWVLVLLLALLGPAASASAGQDQALYQKIYSLMAQMKNADFGDPAQARALARRFFGQVAAEAGGKPVFEVLRQTRRYYARQGRWEAVSHVEHELMAVVRQGVVQAREQVLRRRAASRSLGTIYGYSDSGKWSTKPKGKLTFDGDFDWTLFALNPRDCNPNSGLIAEFKQSFSRMLGVPPESLDVVVTGIGYEAEAGVYVSSGGRRWALNNMKNFTTTIGGKTVTIRVDRFNAINPVTGQRFASPGEAVQIYTQLAALRQVEPGFFQNGRLKPGLTQKDIVRALVKHFGVESEFSQLFLRRVGAHHAATGNLDLTLHFHEAAQASTPQAKAAKGVKFLARGASLTAEGLSGTDWRRYFTPSELRTLRTAALAEGATQAQIEALAKLTQFVAQHRNPDGTFRPMSTAEQAELDRLLGRAREAKAEFKRIMTRLLGSPDPPESRVRQFTRRGKRLLQKMAQVGYWMRVKEILAMGDPARRTQALTTLRNEYRKILDAYQGKSPPQDLEWARQAEAATAKLLKAQQENPEALGKLLAGIKKLHKILNTPLPVRRKLKSFLGKTELGKAILKHTPASVWEAKPPEALRRPSFGATTEFVLELVKQPYKAAGGTANALMMIDLAWNMVDLWNSPAPWYTKTWELGKLLTTMLVPHLYLIPAMYHASLSGDPNAVAYALACFVCPPLMLPQLIQSLGNRFVAGQQRAYFQKELEEMLKASVFDPPVGREPQELLDRWLADPSQVRYRWVSLQAVNDTYRREGTPSLADYILGLATKDPEVMALSAVYRPGEGEITSGIRRLVVPGAVAAAFRAMLENGDHRFFRENAALARALQEYRDFTCMMLSPHMSRPPAYCRYAWADHKSGIKLDLLNNTLAQGEEARLHKTVVYTIRKLLEERARKQRRIAELLAQSIITSFEEEMRARKMAELGAIGPFIEEIKSLAKALGIEKELVRNFMAEFDRIDRKDTTQQALVANRWLEAYRRILAERQFLLGICANLKVPLQEQRHLLHGSPPLKGEIAHDTLVAANLHRDCLQAVEWGGNIPFVLKGRKLYSDPRDQQASLTLGRYLVMAAIQAMRVRAPHGQISGWWDPVDKLQEPERFAEQVTKRMQKLANRDFKTLFGYNTALLDRLLHRYRLTARGYCRWVNRFKVYYLSRLELAPRPPLKLPPDQPRKLWLRPRHPQAELRVAVRGVDSAVLSVAPASAHLAPGGKAGLELKRPSAPAGSGPPPPQTSFELAPTPRLPAVLQPYADQARPVAVPVGLSGGLVVELKAYGRPAGEESGRRLLFSQRLAVGGRP